jgi:hypothetical protein
MDPREARLVMHGWFTEPKPFLKGALSARRAAPVLDEAVAAFAGEMENLGEWHGTLSLRIAVSPTGSSRMRVLADTLVPVGSVRGEARVVRRLVARAFSGLRFPQAGGTTEITLPLLFR